MGEHGKARTPLAGKLGRGKRNAKAAGTPNFQGGKVARRLTARERISGIAKTAWRAALAILAGVAT